MVSLCLGVFVLGLMKGGESWRSSPGQSVGGPFVQVPVPRLQRCGRSFLPGGGRGRLTWAPKALPPGRVRQSLQQLPFLTLLRLPYALCRGALSWGGVSETPSGACSHHRKELLFSDMIMVLW